MQKKYRRMLIMLVYILVVSSTIAYSALTSTLQLNAEAKLRTISDIRVTGISLSSANGGTLQYESSYDVNTITSGFVLPTTDSSITYKVTVTNNGTIDQTIYDILTQSSNNSGLYYEISGYNVRDVIGFKTVVEFYITYKTTTPSEEPINVVNKFNFKKVYHVTFEAKGGTSITDGIKYEGVDLDLSTFTSTKQGYILSGWTDEQDGTTVKYQTNGTYTLDRDLILYAVWEGNPNTSYSVNHYVHDLGTNTYTLDSTDNLTGTTDSTLTLASLKKTIPGFTYVDGYLTGGTTKPTEGAVTTTTILADGSRVINLYYRRNYLYVQYHVNGGQLAEQHGSHFGITNSLVTSTGNTTPNKFWVGVYGSKVNAVTNANTYTQGAAGLDNYNNPNYLNLEKTGYTGKSGQEWNTNASGTGTSYSQATTTYDANTFGGADLSTGDQVVTLYVNWVPVDYEIMYDLQGGTLATSNPATYNIETDTFTLNNPTLTGYTFVGWTGSNGETPETTVTIPTGSTGDKAYIANWQANTYTVTADANGGSIPSTTGWNGTGNTSTKSVTYDNAYGTLPTVSRTSYTFKGWSLLPEGYTQVEYIESSGTQYILTDVVPSSKFKIETDVYISAYGNQPTIAGVSDNNCIQFYYDNTPSVWTKGGSIKDSESYYKQKIHYIAEANSSGLKLDVNGKVYTGPYSYNGGTSNHLMIFAYNINDNAKFPLSGRIYTLKLFDDSELIRNFVPCINNTTGKAGLYDLVTNTFYGNSGTGDFIAGDEEFITSETIVKETSNHTLKAIWEAVNYEITYDLQGGTLSTTNPATYNIETNTFTLNNPTLTGYTFTGWTGSNGNTPETTVTIPAGSTGDKAYIANWQANTYDVTFDTNGGTIGANELFSFDGSTHTIDGTIVGATWGDDYLQFAGNSSSYVNLGQINSDYMTLQATFSIDEPATRSQVIMGSLEVGGASIHIESYSGEYVIAGQVRVGNSYRVISSDIVPEVGKKYNVLLSYDGKVEKLYINNVLIGTTEIEGVIKTPSSNTIMALGGNPYEDRVTKEYFKGKIYNASIYSNPKKQVTYDSPYGTLPTPTRNGYTFKGWNGKNLLNTYNTSSYTKNGVTGSVTNNGLINISGTTTSSTNYGILAFNWYGLPELEIGKQYTFSISKDLQGLYVQVNYKNTSGREAALISKTTKDKFTFTPPNNYSYLNSYFIGVVKNSENIDETFTVQLEEGTVATAHEPYYVTNTVNVTQAKDHTLKAIWELKDSTLLVGYVFNQKIKKLAGNQDATHETANTNITSIVRSNSLTIMPTDDNVVSTSDSNIPTYAWFDSNTGTLYYYTDAVNIYMNSNSHAMFYNFTNLTNINISDFNTSKVTNMSNLFSNCTHLTSVDLGNFDTSQVTNMNSMFVNASSITTLDLSTFDMSKVTAITNMLLNVTSLKTLKTPSVYPTDSSVKITLPKLMVDASGNEYTELNSSSPTNTMLYTPATFLPGQEFNAKIRQLAGNQDATYETADTNITSIVRSNTLSITPTSDNIVSTNDSYTPIYAWYDNGTIYYYTEYSNPYMNTNGSKMFYKLRNVVSIDVSTIKTSQTTNMWALFHDCYELTSLNLSSFNTSNVTTMQAMFANCRSLTSLNLSGFNTSNVTNMRDMFYYCTSLSELSVSNFNTSKVTTMIGMFNSCSNIRQLDLSNFDMGIVTGTDYMLTNMSSLESLKTPKVYPSEAVIQMPKTLYDPSGNGWSVLDSSAPTETWLHKMVCKRATTLHTETCSQTSDSLYCSGAGYKVGGSKNTSTITYGSLGTNDSTLNGGDAFTCDVNGDGTFNEATERFYYVGDYYNTTTKEFETDTGVLVYYNNVSGGTPNNTTTSAYDSSGENWHGPVTAISQLPTTSQWSNVGLKNNTRAILTYNNGSMTDGGTLPNDFSYSGYSARLLTVQEINHSLNRSLSSLYSRLDDVAPYLFENTKYSTPTLNFRWWLESVSTNNASAYSVMTTLSNSYSNGIYSYAVAIPTGISVRPAIEVNKNFLNKKVNAYLITYDTNGGSENTTQTVNVGDSLESLSVPTKEGYTFNGWYTEASGGEEVTTATVPTATTTYYAHWTPIDYNITYDLDGGEVGTANPTTYNPDSNSITLNNPTKTGYTFAGWSGGKNIQTIPTIYATVTEARNTTIDQMFFIKAGTYTYTRNVDGVSSLRDAIILKDLNGNDLSDSSYSPNNSYYYNTSYQAWIIGTDSTGSTLSRTITIKEDCYIKFVVMFGGSSNTKIISQLEEGTTSTYVDKQTTVTIPTSSTGNRVYTANWTANNYTVTADANGGSIPSTTGWTGTGNTATKSVTYNSPYGTLPTPTRNGYTFKGWNGKNLLNIDKMTNDALINNNDGTYTIWYKSTGRYGEYFDVDIPENTKLIMNYELLEYNGTYPAPLQIVGIGDGNAFYIYDKNSVKNVNINISKIRIYQEGTQPIGTYTKFKNLQLEEGATATPYEPYYVTSSTNVTQDKNHTLKAIWEMDTYEIQYDLQGGSLANSNPATYNVETNTFTLNNPTLTGQTFIGWTGSNGNTPEVNVTIPVGSYGDKAYVAHFSPIYEPETRIRSLNTIGTSIADDDPDSNLRFIGSNPNNYVSFNGQKWRIIGVFDGKLKIIGDSIGKYSWDTSRNTVNKGYGINQWGPSGTYTGADLMKLLNPGYSSNTDLKCNNTYSDGNCGTNDDSDYTTGLVNNSLWWNAQSGYCYNYANYKTTACDFTNTGLKTDTARNMIDNATWYLGSNLVSDNIWDGRMTASYLYNIERSNNTGKQCQGGNDCNDDVTRTTTWQGKVGLLYPSDYAYATSGGTTHNRNTCLTVSSGYSEDNSVQNWDNTYTDCKNNNWIVDTSQWTWFISPRSIISISYGVFFMYYKSSIRSNLAFAAGSVRPVVYLKSSVKFTSGDGSYNSPFNLIDTE